ncbi:MAG: MBL fold metallo-hydrolase [Halieaceae bacterium]
MKIRNALLLMAVMGPLLVSCTGAPAWKGESSDHFNGDVFVNRIPMQKTAGDLVSLGWGSVFEAEEWPEWIDIPQQQVPQQRVARGLSVTFVNHASFLIQVDGINILTDPIFSERASPFQWAGPARVHQPGIAFEDLPPIDVILISHNHYDHLDEGSLRRFAALEQQPLIVAGLGNGDLFRQWGLNRYQDLDWEQSTSFGDVRFTFTECRHRSGRGVADQMKTLWGSFVISADSGNVYFAGDTGYGPHFSEAGARHGPFALALLPIGAYEPRWFMRDVHVDPEEAVQAHLDLGAERSIGMHFGTFQLTYEKIDQPQTDLALAMAVKQLPPQAFQTLEPGASEVIVVATEKQRSSPGLLY